jgi:mRNA interferase HigB
MILPVNIVARPTLVRYWTAHRETEQPLVAWYRTACAANWQSMTDIVTTYSKASPINYERCVFDICGGNYRLIVAFHFRSQSGYIKFIGTHAEYDRIDAATVDMF